MYNKYCATPVYIGSSRIIKITVTITNSAKAKLVFLDSLLICPDSLASLASGLNVTTKGAFPHLFIDSVDMLSYVGPKLAYEQYKNLKNEYTITEDEYNTISEP